MSFYPIIKINNIDFTKITLVNSKTGNLKSNDKNKKCSFISYEINYNYDRIGNNKLFFLTNFLQLEKFNYPFLKKENNDEKFIRTLSFTLSENESFNNFIKKLFDNLEQQIKNLHNYEFNKKYSINENNQIKLLFKLYNGTVTTSINCHKLKKEGGKIVNIHNLPINDFVNQLSKELKFFKSKSYGKIIENNESDKDNKFKISYSGKFIISVKCMLIKNEFIENDKLNIDNTLVLTLYVKEGEIKFTGSKIISILDTNTKNLITQKNVVDMLVL